MHDFVTTGVLPEGMRMRDVKYISQGEDLAFSGKAKDAGYSIWCVHLPGLKHFKTKALSHDSEVARAMAMAKEESVMGEIVDEGAA